MNWIDTRDRLPHDMRAKIVTVHNRHQDRYYIQIATYNISAARWEPVTGSVTAWMDAPEVYRRDK